MTISSGNDKSAKTSIIGGANIRTKYEDSSYGNSDGTVLFEDITETPIGT